MMHCKKVCSQTGQAQKGFVGMEDLFKTDIYSCDVEPAKLWIDLIILYLNVTPEWNNWQINEGGVILKMHH